MSYLMAGIWKFPQKVPFLDFSGSCRVQVNLVVLVLYEKFHYSGIPSIRIQLQTYVDLFWNKQDYLKKCILVWIRKNCTGLWRELFRFALFEKFWCENCISSIWPQGQNFLGQNVSRVKVSGVKVSFEELGVKVSGVKVPLGSKCPGVKVSLGSKWVWANPHYKES